MSLNPNWNKCILFLVPDNVGKMRDYSPSGNHALQATAANQPALSDKGVNTPLSLEFNGTVYPNSSYLQGAAFSSLDKTFFGIAMVSDFSSGLSNCIFMNNISNTNRNIVTIYPDGTLRASHYNGSYSEVSGSFDAGTFHTFSVSMTAGRAWTLFVDGEQYSGASAAGVDGSVGHYFIGIRDEHVTPAVCEAYKGNIQAFGAFDYVLPTDEHEQLHKYLLSFDLSHAKAIS